MEAYLISINTFLLTAILYILLKFENRLTKVETRCLLVHKHILEKEKNEIEI